MKYFYGITETGVIFRTRRDKAIERLDRATGTWVVDFSLLGVYSDDIAFSSIAEERVQEEMSANSQGVLNNAKKP